MGTLSTPAPGIRTVLMSNSWFAGLPEVVRDSVVARARGRTLAPGERNFSRSNPLVAAGYRHRRGKRDGYAGPHRARRVRLMPVVWRLLTARFADSAFTGEGARLYGGRWNRKGVPMVCTAGSQSLAMLEMLLQDQPLRGRYVMIAATLPSNLKIERMSPDQLPADWCSPATRAQLQDIGSDWAQRGSGRTQRGHSRRSELPPESAAPLIRQDRDRQAHQVRDRQAAGIRHRSETADEMSGISGKLTRRCHGRLRPWSTAKRDLAAAIARPVLQVTMSRPHSAGRTPSRVGSNTSSGTTTSQRSHRGRSR